MAAKKKTPPKAGRPPAGSRKTCIACPPEKALKSVREFYTSTNPLHRDGHVPICKECIFFTCYNAATDEIDIEAFKKLLCQMDRPWIDTAWTSAVNQYNAKYSGKVVTKGDDRKNIISFYFKNINSMVQYKNMGWEDGLKQNIREGHVTEEIETGYGVMPPAEQPHVEKPEVKLSKGDKQNMNFVIDTVGYDPFDDCGFSAADRRDAFNILASYCDNDGVSEDGHKIQSVIQITQIQLQCRKVDQMINDQLAVPAATNMDILKSLSDTKKKLLDTASKLAAENSISAANSKKQTKGANTLSYKMKELADNNFERIKVNLFDIKTCEAMRQIADLSNRSIMDQLAFDANDYTEIIKDQREMITSLTEKCDQLEEENRLMKNELASKKK